MTVPASPQSTVAPCSCGVGVTRREIDAGGVRRQLLSVDDEPDDEPDDESLSSIVAPMARSAAIMRSVSRLRSAPVMVEGPDASAARMSARLVMDLEPGMVTVAVTGCRGVGASHSRVSGDCAFTVVIVALSARDCIEVRHGGGWLRVRPKMAWTPAAHLVAFEYVGGGGVGE